MGQTTRSQPRFLVLYILVHIITTHVLNYTYIYYIHFIQVFTVQKKKKNPKLLKKLGESRDLFTFFVNQAHLCP